MQTTTETTPFEITLTMDASLTEKKVISSLWTAAIKGALIEYQELTLEANDSSE